MLSSCSSEAKDAHYAQVCPGSVGRRQPLLRMVRPTVRARCDETRLVLTGPEARDFPADLSPAVKVARLLAGSFA